ncbi:MULTISPECIES: DUF6333 family protein [unclassified Streptomyces]|uniref:DUF6333 family protein n=1 Tax=unclassified Streptomyces TaxID=2593676 RepID=UPI00114CD9CA|nr:MULTISPECIES: DUF6333 family protein [unclassified Streptomyces]MYT15289.1 hypothetical protein [Streptomyces sp. SID4951]
MSDTGFWTFPPDRITRGSGVRYELTVLNPPFTVEVADLPPNDPERAAEFAGSLGTIDYVTEDLGLRKQSDTITVATRADLDLVQVGAWGNLVSVSDPAFADDGNLDDEANQNDWGALATACLAGADPWGRAALDAFSLRVRHSEHTTSHMEALYLSD